MTPPREIFIDPEDPEDGQLWFQAGEGDLTGTLAYVPKIYWLRALAHIKELQLLLGDKMDTSLGVNPEDPAFVALARDPLHFEVVDPTRWIPEDWTVYARIALPAQEEPEEVPTRGTEQRSK